MAVESDSPSECTGGTGAALIFAAAIWASKPMTHGKHGRFTGPMVDFYGSYTIFSMDAMGTSWNSWKGINSISKLEALPKRVHVDSPI